MIEVTNSWDTLCNCCILIMEHMSHLTGLSYGLINILLFVVLGPLSTLIFMVSSIVAKIKGCRNLSIILDIVGSIIILSILTLILYAFLDMPFY